MTKQDFPNRRAVGAGLIAAGALGVAGPAQAAEPSPADKAKAFAALPDWTGIWTGLGTTLFEQRDGARSLNANDPNARDFPPYKPQWETAYVKFLNDVVKSGKFSDPLSLGYPGGMIRMMSPARGLQFVLRPEQVWIVYERPDVRYIYTDGRPFPPKDELWPTFEGYSIGHWEADTLIVETRSLRGGIPLDRTGACLSDEAHVVERIRKTDDKTLQSEITIEDPIALTGPWKVTRRYSKRREQFPRMENVSSLENQRNPVINGETKILLAGDSDPSSPYPDDIRPFSIPKFPFPRK
jgi:hypothetical protein